MIKAGFCDVKTGAQEMTSGLLIANFRLSELCATRKSDEAPRRRRTRLVGWYLMVPPMFKTEGKWKPDLDEAVSEWQHADSYDSAGACKQGLNDRFRAMRKSTFDNPSERPGAILQLQLGECIASDDPRLKQESGR